MLLLSYKLSQTNMKNDLQSQLSSLYLQVLIMNVI